MPGTEVVPAVAAVVVAVAAPTEVAVGVLSSLAYPLDGRPFGSPGVLAAALASAETPLPVAFLFVCPVLDLTAVLAAAYYSKCRGKKNETNFCRHCHNVFRYIRAHTNPLLITLSH